MNKKLIVVVGAIAVIAIVVGGIWIALVNKAPNKTAHIDVASITTFEQCSAAGFPIIKHYPDQCQTPAGRIFVNQNPPAESELVKAEQAIRTFMGEPNLELAYKGQNKHPDNFSVLSNVKANTGGFTADNPEEWDRPVYIFEQKDYINDRCEIYRYQVSQKTYQVLEIGIAYPMERNAAIPGNCPGNGSLETPLKTKDQIEQVAYTYLSHDPQHTTILLRNSIAPKYTSSKPGSANPAQNEWSWEDKNVSLPQGLTGDPWPHPMIRIIMSSGGKLIYYLNTTDLFNNSDTKK